MTDGTFEGNSSTTDGGAVSVRQSCTATFKNTVFKGNSTQGTGEWGSGSAIYAGNATLSLDSVTITGNTAPTSGYGSAININGSTFNIKGKLNISDNAIYIHKNMSSGMKIVGAIEDGSVITIKPNNTTNAVAKGDGVNVTDVSAYASFFIGDNGQTVYESNGSLYWGTPAN